MNMAQAESKVVALVVAERPLRQETTREQAALRLSSRRKGRARFGESQHEIAASRAYGNVNNQCPRQKVGDLPVALVLHSTRTHRSVI